MKVLVLGGTGAMGRHLVRLLCQDGFEVDVTTRSKRKVEATVERYLVGDAHDWLFLNDVLANGSYDVVVDFMVWRTRDYSKVAKRFLSYAYQYIFVSSYRVYADAPVLTEESPRLLDVCQDETYLRTDEYALAKARCEDILRHSGSNGWTIVRPGITYDSSGRFQLGVLEAGSWLWRSTHGYSIAMPDELLRKRTTMTSGFDVACMIRGLVGKSSALGEAYNLATSESLLWSDVLRAYRSEIPVCISPCTTSQYEWAAQAPYQLRYDRMYNRVIDNSKVLEATGLSQSDFLPACIGLSDSLHKFLDSGKQVTPLCGTNSRIDSLTRECCLGALVQTGKPSPTIIKYIFGRLKR